MMAWGMGGSKEYKSSSKKSVSFNSAVRPMMTFRLVGPARMDRAASTAWVRARFSEGSGCPRASTTTVCLRCSASASSTAASLSSASASRSRIPSCSSGSAPVTVSAIVLPFALMSLSSSFKAFALLSSSADSKNTRIDYNMIG